MSCHSSEAGRQFDFKDKAFEDDSECVTPNSFGQPWKKKRKALEIGTAKDETDKTRTLNNLPVEKTYSVSLNILMRAGKWPPRSKRIVAYSPDTHYSVYSVCSVFSASFVRIHP
jgi:hypothetical protein